MTPPPPSSSSSSSYPSTSTSTSSSSNPNGLLTNSPSTPLLSSVRSLFDSKTNSNSVLTDLAPHLLSNKIINSVHFSGTSTSTSGSSGAVGGGEERGGEKGMGMVSSFGMTSKEFRKRLGFNFGSSSIVGSSSSRGGNSYEGTSNQIYIIEKIDELLGLEIPPSPFLSSTSTFNSSSSNNRIDYTTGELIQEVGEEEQVPLIRGFLATKPTVKSARLERRRQRSSASSATPSTSSSILPPLVEETITESIESLDINKRGTGIGVGKSPKKKRRGPSGVNLNSFNGIGSNINADLGDEILLSVEELQEQVVAVEEDMSHVTVRRALYNTQIIEIESKMQKLDSIREGLRRNILGLREEELELEDELQGLQEQILITEERKKGRTVSASSRRRKGPAFLPSEHDDLPSGVAFMTLIGHLAPITSLDFSEPYGVAVTASLDESVRLWDLSTGDELGFLKGHSGTVKALQVEASLCVTGGQDGQIRIWDLDIAESIFPLSTSSTSPNINNNINLSSSGSNYLNSQSMENVLLGHDNLFGTNNSGGGSGLVNGNSEEGMMREENNNKRGTGGSGGDDSLNSPCIKTLAGHTKDVTALYFENSTLVTGSSDRTLRQWDLQTGQCILTMDILWAISHPLASQTLSSVDPLPSSSSPYPTSYSPTSPSRTSLGALRRQSSSFIGTGESVNTTTYSDGSWDLYQDYVGGVQCWNYALASGTGDGCVRMWDMRTGQAQRTLVGHTAPVSCLQFDEYHLVSGSLDKSVRIWDLRTGSIFETIRYDHPITAVQFDSRKIIAAAGENGVRVYNRTTLQHSTLTMNGHTSPMERLRYQDRYLVSGGRDCAVKVWALP